MGSGMGSAGDRKGIGTRTEGDRHGIGTRTEGDRHGTRGVGLALSAWEIQLVSPFIEAFTLFIWLMVEYSETARPGTVGIRTQDYRVSQPCMLTTRLIASY